MTPTIEIVGPPATWADEFAALATRLREAFGATALRIDHIGSTAVPGLAAKDVIDIQVTVAALDEPLTAAALAASGLLLRPGLQHDHRPPGREGDPADAWAKLMGGATGGGRRAHVHVRRAGAPNQRYPLLFRDFLRADPLARASYQAVKVALARLHPDDVGAYYEVKDPVCDIVIAGAERWAAATGWVVGPGGA